MANIVRQTFTNQQSSPTWTAPGGVTEIKAVSTSPVNPISIMGAQNAVALLDTGGNAYGFGINTNGNLGNGNVTPQSSPVALLGGLKFQQIFYNGNGALDGYTMFGLDALGNAYGWGSNDYGQLGIGSTTPQSSPVAVLGGLKFQKIGSGQVFGQQTIAVFGLDFNNNLYGWGCNFNGQLGVGTSNTYFSSPIAVLGGLKFQSWVCSKSAGTASNQGCVLALTTSGVAYGWGGNASGQLGNGTVTSVSSPVAVLGGLTFKQISCDASSGNPAVLALTTSGVAYGWGANSNGQLGIGNLTPQSSPVAVLGGLTFQCIVTYAGSSWGLTTSGALYAWGVNSGILGVGQISVLTFSSPIAVLGGLTFQPINGMPVISNDGGNNYFALTTSGVLYGWGFNNSGALGIGNTTPVSSPVAVLGGLSFNPTGVSSVPCVADMSGNLYSWGVNTSGQLGTGNVTATSSPVAVLGSHFPLVTAPTLTQLISVVPGTTYTINLQQPIGKFGTTYLGFNVSQLVIEYEQ